MASTRRSPHASLDPTLVADHFVQRSTDHLGELILSGGGSAAGRKRPIRPDLREAGPRLRRSRKTIPAQASSSRSTTPPSSRTAPASASSASSCGVPARAFCGRSRHPRRQVDGCSVPASWPVQLSQLGPALADEAELWPGRSRTSAPSPWPPSIRHGCRYKHAADRRAAQGGDSPTPQAVHLRPTTFPPVGAASGWSTSSRLWRRVSLSPLTINVPHRSPSHSRADSAGRSSKC